MSYKINKCNYIQCWV